VIVVLDNECECELELEYGVGVSGPADADPGDTSASERGFTMIDADAYVSDGRLEGSESFDDGTEFLLLMLCR
jgi:hypothetical protein